MTAGGPRRGRRRIALTIWLVIAVFYSQIVFDYIRLHTRDSKLLAAMEHVVQIGGADQRPAKEIREFLLVKADELRLPIRAEQITITGDGPTLTITVAYDATIGFPLISPDFYHRHFQHTVAFHRL